MSDVFNSVINGGEEIKDEDGFERCSEKTRFAHNVPAIRCDRFLITQNSKQITRTKEIDDNRSI